MALNKKKKRISPKTLDEKKPKISVLTAANQFKTTENMLCVKKPPFHFPPDFTVQRI
jgi:hypothetical protein